jgi:hypothetical protein
MEPVSKFPNHEPINLSTNEQASRNTFSWILIPLVFAAVLKIWIISQSLGQLLIVADQIAQLAVIVSIALVCGAPGFREKD